MKRGSYNYTPFLITDEDTGEDLPIYMPADAIMSEAKTGTKSGNYMLDEMENILRNQMLIDNLKDKFKNSKHRFYI